MILADIELALRIDGFEARGSKAIGEGVARRNSAARAFIIPAGLGYAVYCGPDSPGNKVIGMGLNEDVEASLLQEIEEAYFARASAVQAEVATLARPAVHALFTQRGYVLQGFEDVLGRLLTDADASPVVSPGLRIDEVMDSGLASWIDVMITGFERPDDSGAGSGIPLPPRQALEEAFGPSVEVPGFHAYLASVNGALAGGAGLRSDEKIGQLCGAATLPAYRRRGIQTALLRRRLYDAHRAGCDLAIMTAQPGSKSHFNAQRQGFELLYSRALLVKTPPAAR